MPPCRSRRANTEFSTKWQSNLSRGPCGRCGKVDKDETSSSDGSQYEKEDVDSDASTELDFGSPKRGRPYVPYEIRKPKKNQKFDMVEPVKRNSTGKHLCVNGFRFYPMARKRDERGIQWFMCASYINPPLNGHRCLARAAIFNGKLVSLDCDHTHSPPRKLMMSARSVRKDDTLMKLEESDCHDSDSGVQLEKLIKCEAKNKLEWITSKEYPEKQHPYIGGHRFYRYNSQSAVKTEGVEWFRCADSFANGGQPCTVRAVMLNRKLISLDGTHNHGPHIKPTGSATDLTHHQKEKSDSNLGQHLGTDHARPLERRSTAGQESDSLEEVSHDSEPESDPKVRSLCEPNSDNSLKEKSRDEEGFASNMSLLLTESRKLDQFKNKPLSVRVRFLEKLLDVKEVMIKTLVEELCVANDIIMKQGTESKSKEDNGQLDQ
ncbi:hypothetical protein HDE_07918 [Halotydeus destructor]|nr:hypothetical protein HDE_07918 [Halotydeus destructor]